MAEEQENVEQEQRVPVFKGYRNLRLGREIKIKARIQARVFTIRKKEDGGRRTLYFLHLPKKFAESFGIKDDDVLELEVIRVWVDNEKIKPQPIPPVVRKK